MLLSFNHMEKLQTPTFFPKSTSCPLSPPPFSTFKYCCIHIGQCWISLYSLFTFILFTFTFNTGSISGECIS